MPKATFEVDYTLSDTGMLERLTVTRQNPSQPNPSPLPSGDSAIGFNSGMMGPWFPFQGAIVDRLSTMYVPPSNNLLIFSNGDRVVIKGPTTQNVFISQGSGEVVQTPEGTEFRLRGLDTNLDEAIFLDISQEPNWRPTEAYWTNNADWSRTTHVYHPEALAMLKGHFFRPMQASGTNNHPVNRPPLTETNWTTGWYNTINSPADPDFIAGWDVLVDLANQAECSGLWINIPIASTEGFLRRLAEYIRDNAAFKHVRVAHTNECWNGIPPFSWAKQYVEDRGLPLPDWTQFITETQNPDGSISRTDDPFQSGQFYHASETLRIGKTFKEILEPAGFKVETILEVSTFMHDHLREILRANNEDYFGGAGTGFDAFAIAPYFGNTPKATQLFQEKAPAATIATEILNNITSGEIVEEIIAMGQVAAEYNIPMYAYEANHHLLPEDSAEDTAVRTYWSQIYEEPNMLEAYSVFLKTWRQNNGKDIIIYNCCDARSQREYFGARYSWDRPIHAPHIYWIASHK